MIIGENRSFDHVFATYQPKSGRIVWNLLSEGIVNADGTPGRNFAKAEQNAAADQAPDAFLLSPDKVRSRTRFCRHRSQAGRLPRISRPKTRLPWQPDFGARTGAREANGKWLAYRLTIRICSLEAPAWPRKTPDTRITNVTSLPPGPFQLTNGKTFTYDSYAASPVHRFYQMWQQLDCSRDHITFENPSGCNARLFPWVEVTVGAGANGMAQPSNFSTEYSPSADGDHR